LPMLLWSGGAYLGERHQHSIIFADRCFRDADRQDHMIALFVDDVAILLQKSQTQDERRRILFRFFHVCSPSAVPSGKLMGSLCGLARLDGGLGPDAALGLTGSTTP
jgi:hypothetical protein